MDLQKLKKDELNDFAASHLPDLKIDSTMKHAKMVKLIKEELKNQDLKEEDFAIVEAEEEPKEVVKAESEKELNKEEVKELEVKELVSEPVQDGRKCSRCGSIMVLVEAKTKGYAKYKEYICDNPQEKTKCGRKKTVM